MKKILVTLGVLLSTSGVFASPSSSSQLMKELLQSAQGDCKIVVQDNSALSNEPALASFSLLSLAVTSTSGKTEELTVVGEPEVFVTRYFSNTDKRYKYTTVFRGSILDSRYPTVPNKLEVVNKDGQVTLAVLEAHTNLNGGAPEYSSNFFPCIFKK